MSTGKDLATNFVRLIPCLSQWLQSPHPARQSRQFLEEKVSHWEEYWRVIPEAAEPLTF
jgi:hypothetical protein